MSFEEFAATRLSNLLRFAIVLTHDRGLAEDVCQDVLLRAQKRWAVISAMQSPEAYLRRMVVNEYLSWRRKWSRIVPRQDIHLDRTEPDHADQHADRAELLSAVARLPRRQRAAVVLRFFEGLEDPEIADLLGCTSGTVRGYIWRALRTLRIDVGDAEPTPTRPTVPAALTTKDT